jgi:hypothetical protein
LHKKINKTLKNRLKERDKLRFELFLSISDRCFSNSLAHWFVVAAAVVVVVVY